MIAFGCASTDEREFRAGAARAIEGASENDSLLMRRHAGGSLAAAYDEMLAEAAEHDDLEAVALVGQSICRLDSDLAARLRRLLAAGPDVAVVGAAPAGGAREVESVGGSLLVLSARAARELRCDESVSGALGPLAMDLCFQARARGGRVVASGALHLGRASPRYLSPEERRAWLRASVAARRKWGAELIPPTGLEPAALPAPPPGLRSPPDGPAG